MIRAPCVYHPKYITMKSMLNAYMIGVCTCINLDINTCWIQNNVERLQKMLLFLLNALRYASNITESI